MMVTQVFIKRIVPKTTYKTWIAAYNFHFKMICRVLWFVTLFLPHGNSDPIYGGADVGYVKKTNSKVIVEGQNHYPFMAHLHIIKKSLAKNRGQIEEQFQCGGVIINAVSVLTAAHCLVTDYGTPLIYVKVGIVDLVEEHYTAIGSWVMDFVINEGFVKSYEINRNLLVAYMCDIGIVFLEKSLTFTTTVQKAIFNEYEGELRGLEGSVIGWGIDDSGKPMRMLKRGDTTIISNEFCRNFFDDLIIQSDHLCILSRSGLVSPCKGDSGGPLVINGVVYGINSFAAIEETGKRRSCDPNKPQILTRISYFTSWIKEKLEEQREKIIENRITYCKRRYDDAFDDKALDLRIGPKLEDILEAEPL